MAEEDYEVGQAWGHSSSAIAAIETQEKQPLGFGFLICKLGADSTARGSATQHAFPFEQGPSLWGASSTITDAEGVSGALPSLEAPSPPWGFLAPRIQGPGRPPRAGRHLTPAEEKPSGAQSLHCRLRAPGWSLGPGFLEPPGSFLSHQPPNSPSNKLPLRLAGNFVPYVQKILSDTRVCIKRGEVGTE